MRLKIPGCWPLRLEFSLSHWHKKGTNHGPQSLPRLMIIHCVRTQSPPPRSGRNVWFYFRGGYAARLTVILERVPKELLR